LSPSFLPVVAGTVMATFAVASFEHFAAMRTPVRSAAARKRVLRFVVRVATSWGRGVVAVGRGVPGPPVVVPVGGDGAGAGAGSGVGSGVGVAGGQPLTRPGAETAGHASWLP
jgi:hypothetical protein